MCGNRNCGCVEKTASYESILALSREIDRLNAFDNNVPELIRQILIAWGFNPPEDGEGGEPVVVNFRIEHGDEISNWRGFGVSLTGSWQEVYNGGDFDRADADDILEAAFSTNTEIGANKITGIGVDIARVYIGNIAPDHDDFYEWNDEVTASALLAPWPAEGVTDYSVNGAQEHAVEVAYTYNPNIKVEVSCVSPPAWLKTNASYRAINKAGVEGHPIVSRLDDYADLLAGYVRHYYDNGPYRVNYLSLVNEPQLVEGGLGSVWTRAEVGAGIIALDAALRDQGLRDTVMLQVTEQAGYASTVQDVDWMHSNPVSVSGWGTFDAINTHL